MSSSLSAAIPDVSTLNVGEPTAPPAPVSPGAGTVVSLTPFLALMRELAAEIIPLRLRLEFRDELQRELMAAARQQYARDLLIWSPLPQSQAKSSRRWMLGAATLGSAMSVASIVAAYYWRTRHRRAA